MDLNVFLKEIERIAPGYGYGAGTRFDAMPVYHRLAITRWLADALEQPTDLDVVRQLATLGDAHRWLDAALRGGEQLRADAAGSSRLERRPGCASGPLLEQDLLPHLPGVVRPGHVPRLAVPGPDPPDRRVRRRRWPTASGPSSSSS